MFGFTVFKAGTGGEAVSLPVTGILAVVAAALGAGVDPDGLSGRNHLAAGCIGVAVGTLLAFRAALPRLVDGVDTWWRSTICDETAGDAITVTSALLTF